MRSARFRWVLVTSVLLGLALVASPGTRGRPTGLSGPAEGILVLPDQGLPGVMLGALLDPTGSRVVFELQASLTAVGVACPACFAGDITGTLDDGVGPGPDLAVRGFYVGNTFDGTGTFDATIVRLPGRRGGDFVVGEIQGRLAVPPGTPGPGLFEGTWRLREDLPSG